MGIDLGLKFTGLSVLEPHVRDRRPTGLLVAVTHYVIKPPGDPEAQEAADYIAHHIGVAVGRYRPADDDPTEFRVFIEAPAINAWGFDEKQQKQVNRTNTQSALSKGRLFGAVQYELKRRQQRYQELAIGRWRKILALEGVGKDAVVAAALKYLRDRGLVFTPGAKEDEIEASGVAAAGLIGMRDPRVLEPGWKPPKRKFFKIKEPKPEVKGLFDGNGNEG